MNENKSPKCKNMMYTQQIGHLPNGIKTEKDLASLIEQKLEPQKYAVIIHDQDMGEDGQPAEAHIHAMMHFENARYLSAVAKKLGEDPRAQYIQKWDQEANNGFAYLVHATTKARKEGKYQYDPSAVVANFDFRQQMEKIVAEIEQARAERTGGDIKSLLDRLYIGTTTKEEIEQQLSGSQYAKYHRQIEDVDAKRLLKEAEKWRAEMREKGTEINVIWITGPAGTGKTSLAKVYAEKKGQPYFITGSSRDVFQGYNGEHTLIIDELRPKMLTYSDLLRITDPHGIENQVMLPCRYADKALACDLIIITTPYTPAQFYNQQVTSFASLGGRTRDDCPDGKEQLFRRITVTLEMTGKKIQASEYSIRGDMFIPIPGTDRPNPYSELARPAPPNKMLDFYNSMFDD